MADVSGGPDLEEVMGIPAASTVAVQVLRLLDDGTASAAQVGEVMDLDPALATRAIFLANSSYYGLRQRVASSARAVPVLGLTAVRALVAGAAFGMFDHAPDAGTAALWPHAVATAVAASVLAEETGVDREVAFSLGLLHDVGAVLLARRDGIAWHELLEADGPDDPLAVERALFGVDHAELGAGALAAARLPDVVVAAVADHHRSDAELRGSRLGLVLVTAEGVAALLGHARPGEPVPVLDRPLRALHVAEDAAAEVCGRAEERLGQLRALLELSHER